MLNINIANKPEFYHLRLYKKTSKIYVQTPGHPEDWQTIY